MRFEALSAVVRFEALSARPRAFEAAERTLDPERLLAFLADDFTMFQDGVHVDRQGTEQQMRSALPALESFEPDFDDVQVIVLGADAALTSMTFRDTIVSGDGSVSRSRGPSTLLWRRRGSDWVIVFADSDHYQVEER